MRKLFLTTLSALALSAGAAHAGNQFHYPSGMTSNTHITTMAQMQALQSAIVSQGKTDGVLNGSYYQNNPNGPSLTETSESGQLGLDNVNYNNGTITVDKSLLSGNMTAEEVASVLAHEDVHPMQAAINGDGIAQDEQASADEHAADMGAASIMGDNGAGLIGWLSQSITDDMNLWGDNLDDANSQLSNSTYGTPWGRANEICDTCSMPHNLLGNTDFDIGADKTIIDGTEETIPDNFDTIDGQLPNNQTNFNDQFAADTQGEWGGDDYWGGGGEWGGDGGTCGKINGGSGAGAAGGGGVIQDILIVWC